MTSRPDLGVGELRVATFKSLKAETTWIAKSIAVRKRDDPEASIAVIVPRGVEIYASEFNAASAANDLGLEFIDSRERLAIRLDPGFRLLYALLRITEDDSDQLAWRTLLAVVPGFAARRVSEMYESGSERLTTALRLKAETDGATAQILETVTAARTQISAAIGIDGLRDTVAAASEALSPGMSLPWDEVLREIGEEYRDDPLIFERALAIAREMNQRTAASVEHPNNVVLVYTIFGAKGQQWHHSYLVGAFRQGFIDVAPADGLRRLYVALTRSMRSLTVSIPRYIRGTQLARTISSDSTSFLPQFVDACREVGATVEVDPPQPNGE